MYVSAGYQVNSSIVTMSEPSSIGQDLKLEGQFQQYGIVSWQSRFLPILAYPSVRNLFFLAHNLLVTRKEDGYIKVVKLS